MIAAATASTPVLSLAALPLFAENSHRGHHAPSSTFRLGTTLAISNTVTGLPGCLYDSGTWSCCSGKERDTETNLDYFGARYYSGAQGRFTTPDWSVKPEPVPYADLNDPQSLNLYAYVRNSPLKNRDLDGHICVFGIGNSCTTVAPPKPVVIPTPGIDTRTMLTLSGVSVRYNNFTVSDARVRQALDGVMMSLGKSVSVVSGDRNSRPKGSPSGSAHLTGQAADFHVVGAADDTAFQKLQGGGSPVGEGLRLIKHGMFTVTEAAHLHLDSRNPNGADAATIFMTEGTAKTNTGVYTPVAKSTEEDKQQ